MRRRPALRVMNTEVLDRSLGSDDDGGDAHQVTMHRIQPFQCFQPVQPLSVARMSDEPMLPVSNAWVVQCEHCRLFSALRFIYEYETSQWWNGEKAHNYRGHCKASLARLRNNNAKVRSQTYPEPISPNFRDLVSP